MPSDDDEEFDNPDYWDEQAAGDIWNELLDNVQELYYNGDELRDRIENDEFLQFAYYEGLFDLDLNIEDRLSIYEMLQEYMMETYDVEFDEVFDWEAWREWYG